MRLDHSFTVHADPDRTFAFLLDVDRVVTCIPGMSSVEQQAPDRFVGVMKVKVGPIGVTYRGTANVGRGRGG
jgi:carbon monoxide dehydrogenase subunit G